jgi:SAM-dependent methyltransferase
VEPDSLDILVAGCGANQAAFLAMKNPDSRVIGIDLSAASLAHEQYLVDKHGIRNLELHQLNLEQASSLGQSFDLIVSSGVLHHLPDPDAGLRALGQVLRPHGAIFLMLYGLYPRVGVHMLQEAFRVIGLQQNAEGVAMVRHALSQVVPRWHHITRYKDPDRGFDAGLVDTFLHARERAYTVPDIFQMITESQLKFQSWGDNFDYSLSRIIPDQQDPLRQAIEKLPMDDQWRCVELIGQSHARHFVVVCRPDRPEADYALNFAGDAWLDYVPSVRSDLKILGERLARPGEDAIVRSLTFSRVGHRVELNAFEGTLFRKIDGQRTIAELLGNETYDDETSLQRVQNAQAFFQRMSDWDHFFFEIP